MIPCVGKAPRALHDSKPMCMRHLGRETNREKQRKRCGTQGFDWEGIVITHTNKKTEPGTCSRSRRQGVGGGALEQMYMHMFGCDDGRGVHE